MEALIGDKRGDELLRGWKLLWMLGMSLLILEAGKGWWLGPELAGPVGFGLLCVRVQEEGKLETSWQLYMPPWTWHYFTDTQTLPSVTVG
jgi:hypothetical protein